MRLKDEIGSKGVMLEMKKGRLGKEEQGLLHVPHSMLVWPCEGRSMTPLYIGHPIFSA